jgi:predicted outer membrane repeat protein
VFKSKSSLKIKACNFTANTAAGAGGAIYSLTQNYKISQCRFARNSAFTMDPSFSTTASQGGALWFSNLALKGTISNCIFSNNVARSGWGGALYGTSASTLSISSSQFTSNSAVSSYTNAALGGAIMISNQVNLSISSTGFEGNFARPNFTTLPLTYSGSGGAIFAQSVSLSITSSTFKSNAVYTGQFDSGATGGALVLEDCEPMSVSNTIFEENFAAGYFGSSSYASSGNGGALYIKFSVATINYCGFYSNWVSAGGVANSLGGAIAGNFLLL